MEWICAFYITVIRSWKGNVRKLVDDKDHSSEIYQTLNILMIEPTPEKFCVLGNFEDNGLLSLLLLWLISKHIIATDQVMLLLE